MDAVDQTAGFEVGLSKRGNSEAGMRRHERLSGSLTSAGDARHRRPQRAGSCRQAIGRMCNFFRRRFDVALANASPLTDTGNHFAFSIPGPMLGGK